MKIALSISLALLYFYSLGMNWTAWLAMEDYLNCRSERACAEAWGRVERVER